MQKVSLSRPYCHFSFKVLLANGIPDDDGIAPIICECCGIVSLLINGFIRKMTEPEYQANPAISRVEDDRDGAGDDC